MSTRTALRPVAVLSGNMASTTAASSPTVLQSLSMLSYEVAWSGTSPVGTLEVQVSNSYALASNGTTGVAGTWTSMPLEINSSTVATTIAILGNTGSGFIDVEVQAGYAARLLYTKTSGTGTITAIVSGKVA